MQQRVEDADDGGAAGVVKDWGVALQSPLVVKELTDDIMRVLPQRYDDSGIAPHTLAFLEDLAQTLRTER
jgi:hypothetical protein